MYNYGLIKEKSKQKVVPGTKTRSKMSTMIARKANIK